MITSILEKKQQATDRLLAESFSLFEVTATPAADGEPSAATARSRFIRMAIMYM